MMSRIIIHQYENNGFYFREFSFSLDGKVIFKPYAKRPAHNAGQTSGSSEKIDNPEYVASVEKAHQLIAEGKTGEAGKLLSVVASDEEYLSSYYGWYGTDEEYWAGGNCDSCKRYYNDNAIIFGVYYKGDFEQPVGFFYRYTDGTKILFAHYDMNGKFLSSW